MPILAESAINPAMPLLSQHYRCSWVSVEEWSTKTGCSCNPAAEAKRKGCPRTRSFAIGLGKIDDVWQGSTGKQFICSYTVYWLVQPDTCDYLGRPATWPLYTGRYQRAPNTGGCMDGNQRQDLQHDLLYKVSSWRWVLDKRRLPMKFLVLMCVTSGVKDIMRIAGRDGTKLFSKLSNNLMLLVFPSASINHMILFAFD
jgi:hypothetical protein